DGIRDFHVTGVQTCALPIYEISLNEAEVEVIQVADNYEIIFPNEIPNLVGLEYEDFGSSLLNIEANEDHLVRITDITLQVNFTRSEERRVGKECRTRWRPKH